MAQLRRPSNGASFKCLHATEQQICVGNQAIYAQQKSGVATQMSEFMWRTFVVGEQEKR